MAAMHTRAEIVKALFGDLVDAEAFAKDSPDAADVHVPGAAAARRPSRRAPRAYASGACVVVRKDDKTVDRIGAGLGVISTVVGAKELGGGVRDIAAARKAPLVLSRGARRMAAIKPAARTAGGLALLGGDVLGTMALKQRADQRKATVAKIGIGELVEGMKTQRRRALKAVGRTVNGVRPTTPVVTAKPVGVSDVVNSSAANAARTARRGFDVGTKMAGEGAKQLAGTPQGKAALGAAGGTGLAAGHEHRDKRQAAQPYVSPYDLGGFGKGADVGFTGTFSKFDDEKRRAYGWASVVSLDGMPVVDRQGDFITLDDIEEAAYVYVRKSRVAGDMHRRTHDDQPYRAGELIESVVFTPEKCEAMGVSKSLAGRWWMGVQVEDPEVWAEVKKRGRTGFSIHGRGKRDEVAYDDVMNGRL